MTTVILDEGPWDVGLIVDLAKSSWVDLPEKIKKLYDSGRLIFLPAGIAVIQDGGHSTVLNRRDILSFRGDDPYAVVHLGISNGSTHS
jgi:hypothetical protein